MPSSAQKGTSQPRRRRHFPSKGAPGCSLPTGAGLWRWEGVPRQGSLCPLLPWHSAFAELSLLGLRLQLQPRGRFPRQLGWLGRAAQAPAPEARGTLCCLMLPWAGQAGGDGGGTEPSEAPHLPGGPGVPMAEGWCRYPGAFRSFGGSSEVRNPHLGWQHSTPRASGCCEAAGDRPALYGVPTLGPWRGPHAALRALPALGIPCSRHPRRMGSGRKKPPSCLESSGPGQVPKHLQRLRARLKPLFFWLMVAEEAAQGCARGHSPSLPPSLRPAVHAHLEESCAY